VDAPPLITEPAPHRKPFMTLRRRHPALWAVLLAVLSAWAQPAPAQSDPLVALPSLDVPSYMGTWYQVAWFPNRFQSQCASDTAATYRQLDGGQVEVINRCRKADGQVDDVTGLARPAGSALRGNNLEPARLEVSFLPPLLRWLPIWGSYWVIQRADDGRYAVISEPKREYLWVLSRTPQLLPADETAIRSRLVQQGFDLVRWQAHPHRTPAAAPR
jgi:apolipoprotein D and lipocalin family protein